MKGQQSQIYTHLGLKRPKWIQVNGSYDRYNSVIPHSMIYENWWFLMFRANVAHLHQLIRTGYVAYLNLAGTITKSNINENENDGLYWILL